MIHFFFILVSLVSSQSTTSDTLSECVTCQAGESRSSALLQKDTKVALGTQKPGLIMWSYGRSATGSFMESLRTSADLRYCNHIKEGFGEVQLGHGHRNLTSSSLQKCMHRDQRLLHVKPEHLLLNGSELRRPHDFFKAAYKAGYRIVVASFRENQLARDISDYCHLNAERIAKDHKDLHEEELHQRRELKLDRPNHTLIERFEEQRRDYVRGFEAAKELGFTIVPCNFADMVVNMCRCVRLALLTLPDKHDSKCVESNLHDEGTHQNMTLMMKRNLTANVNAEIRKMLLGTKYEWMLDLEATDWPEGVVPPIPVATWRQHKLLN